MKGLKKDPIIEEVRRAREELSLMMIHEPEKLKARMADIRERYKDQMVSFPPRRIKVPVKVKKKSP